MAIEARKYGMEMLARLVHESRHADSASVRVAAAVQVKEWGFGKAAQAIDHHVIRDIDKMSIEELRELQDRMVGTDVASALDVPAEESSVEVEPTLFDDEFRPEPIDIEPIEGGNDRS